MTQRLAGSQTEDVPEDRRDARYLVFACAECLQPGGEFLLGHFQGIIRRDAVRLPEKGGDNAVRLLANGGASGAAHGRRLELPAGFQLQEKLTEQSRLADPRLADQADDLRPAAPCAVEGVVAFLRRGKRVMGPLTGMFVRYRGEDYLCNALHAMIDARAQIAFPRWKFSCGAKGTRFVGTFACRPEAMLQVGYEDADGERAWCCNSEIGDLELEVWRGDLRIETLVAEGTAHVEFVSREKRPGVRVSVS